MSKLPIKTQADAFVLILTMSIYMSKNRKYWWMKCLFLRHVIRNWTMTHDVTDCCFWQDSWFSLNVQWINSHFIPYFTNTHKENIHKDSTQKTQQRMRLMFYSENYKAQNNKHPTNQELCDKWSNIKKYQWQKLEYSFTFRN